MDRTGLIAVFVCLALLIGIQFAFPTKHTPPAPAVALASNPAPAPDSLTPLSTNSSAPGTTLSANAVPDKNISAAINQPPAAPVEEKFTYLENADIKVTLSSLGAGVKQVELKKHMEDKTGHVILNEQSRQNIMSLAGWPGADTASFSVQTDSATAAMFTTTLSGGLKWTRTYTLGPEYAVKVVDSLANPGTADLSLPAFSISIGRAEPLRVAGHYLSNSNLYLGAAYLTSTGGFHIQTVNDFNPSSFFGLYSSREARDAFATPPADNGNIRWLAAQNQFFAVVLTPPAERPIDHAQFLCLNSRQASGYIDPTIEPDIESTAFFPGLNVPAGKSVDLTYSLYTGPREYDRLNKLGEDEGQLMNYGHFELLIVPMLKVLHWFYSFIGNYGVAIILLTLCIKIITWPLQSFANRSGKRMQAIAPKLKELQAKYKEQPEKLNTETFALYKEYGVNPFGGCLPALVQMPVFFSLYFMLQNAVELRGQSFLWVHDLTMPDTVLSYTLPFVIPFLGTNHLALNPLPLMVTGLTMVMMRMTPQIGDPQQAKIAQFMPLIFLFIFYNFAAGLSLYYVINNCVSIIQIYRNLKKPMPELKRVVKKT